jgi:hypothetical protein
MKKEKEAENKERAKTMKALQKETQNMLMNKMHGKKSR